MLLTSDREGIAELNLVVIERSANDDAGGAGCGDVVEIFDGANPTRSDDINRDGSDQCGEGIEIRTMEGAVAVNVGEDHMLETGAGESAGDLDRIDVGLVKPTLRGELAVAGIESNRDCFAMIGNRTLDEFWIRDRNRAEDEAIDAKAAKRIDVLIRADAPSELEFYAAANRPTDANDGIPVGTGAISRAVQIHDVDLDGAGLGPAQRRIHRIGIECRLAREVAFDEANSAPSTDIDSRIDDHV